MQFGCDMRSITLRGTPVSILLSAITLVMAPPSRTDSANRSDVVVADSSDVVPAPEARQSPVAIAATTLDDGTHLKVVYSSPRKRDRRIFGALVPFGEVWRTGANEATEITATRDVLLAGHLVPAGTYAIFTVPQPDTWTIILNGVLGQWGIMRACGVLQQGIQLLQQLECFAPALGFGFQFREFDDGVLLQVRDRLEVQ